MSYLLYFALGYIGIGLFAMVENIKRCTGRNSFTVLNQHKKLATQSFLLWPYVLLSWMDIPVYKVGELVRVEDKENIYRIVWISTFGNRITVQCDTQVIFHVPVSKIKQWEDYIPDNWHNSGV